MKSHSIACICNQDGIVNEWLDYPTDFSHNKVGIKWDSLFNDADNCKRLFRTIKKEKHISNYECNVFISAKKKEKYFLTAIMCNVDILITGSIVPNEYMDVNSKHLYSFFEHCKRKIELENTSNAIISMKKDESVYEQLMLLNNELVNTKRELYKTNYELMNERERFRRISEIISDFAYSFVYYPDKTFTLEWATQAFIRITGYDKTMLKSIDDLDNLIHPEDKRKLENRINLLKKGLSDIKEYRIITKMGDIRWIRDFRQAILDEKTGEIAKIIGGAQDITKQKLAEISNQRYLEELIELNATKDKFFSILAHDLRNPFNSLIGLTDILITDNSLSEESRDNIYLALKNASQSGYYLLNNLLKWSQMQTGRIDYKPSKFLFSELVDNNLTLFKTELAKKNITVCKNIPKQTYLYADYNMIDTVIRNLLSNAIKFTGTNGKININVQDFCTQNQIDKIQISIEDTGVGISDENIKKLFDISKKLTTEGTNQEKGSGLGLVLCKEFIEKNQGRIWVESVLGKGSSFKFILPKINQQNNSVSAKIEPDCLDKLQEEYCKLSGDIKTRLQKSFIHAKRSSSITDIDKFSVNVLTICKNYNLSYLTNFISDFQADVKMLKIKKIKERMGVFDSILQ